MIVVNAFEKDFFVFLHSYVDSFVYTYYKRKKIKNWKKTSKTVY